MTSMPNPNVSTPMRTSTPNTTNTSTPMSQDEEFISNAFENYVTLYNNSYSDETKQKDFYNKVSSLFTKLKNHELKINLLKILVDFVNRIIIY